MILYFNFVTKTVDYLKSSYNIADKLSFEAIKTASWIMAVKPLGSGDYTKYPESKINVAMQKFKRNATKEDYSELIDLIIDDLANKKHIISEHKDEIIAELRKFV